MLLAALGACSGHGSGSSGPSQGATTPTAIATPIGYQGTGTNPVVITVRSGADVELTAADSFDGDIGISTFAWTQTDTAPTPAVNLIYRNASTVTFTAPSVASATTLHLQVTVSNQIGPSTATVQVVVQPASDPNRFLSLFGVPHHFRAALSVTSAGHNPGDPIPLSADAPVCVTLNSSIHYLNRAASASSFPLPGAQVDTKWLASAGAVAGFPAASASATTYVSTAYLNFRNPVVSFDLPVLLDDLIFAAYNQPNASTTDQANELVLSDIDQAYVPMIVSATPGSCDGTLSGSALGGLQLMLQLQDQSGNPVGAAVTGPVGGEVTVNSSPLAQPNPLTPDGSSALTPDDFLRVTQGSGAANAIIETRESAAAYFAAINPPSQTQKTTLALWLAANCFDPSSPTYGAGESGYSVVHATYTNNFDLGFGRDMYFATCTSGPMAGNLASVVINYPSLDAAANRVGAFLAVAMEYGPQASASPGACFTNNADSTTNNGTCFTKFYAFAPDDRTGEFQRVMSVDFDRRGQKYLPGACTVCHGGSPNYIPGASPNAAYPSSAARGAGDLDAAFLPWDLSALIFSDTDPAFSCMVSTDAPNCQSVNPTLFSKSAQAPNIQALNALAWRTYDVYSQNGLKDTIVGVQPTLLRFATPVALLTKWYGGDPGAATAHTFDDSATPTGWAPAPGAPDVYHQVYAHYCRSCHTQSNLPFQQFTAGFGKGLTATPGSAPTTALDTLVSVQQLIFSNNQMPLSRLTADRFWVEFEPALYSAQSSAAQMMATYINGTSGVVPVAVDASGNPVPPGQPILAPLLSSNPQPPAVANPTSVSVPLLPATPVSLTRFQGALLDALSQSLFVESYQWSLCATGAPAAPTDPCPGNQSLGLIGTPVVPAGASAAAAQTGSSLPSFPTTAAGNYNLTLTAGNSIVGQTPVSFTYQFTVTPSDSKLGTCPLFSADYSGTSAQLAAASCYSPLGDAPYSLLLSADGTNYSPTAVSTAAWGASVVAPNGPVALDPKTGLSDALPSVLFNFVANGNGNPATLFFELCDGNNVCLAQSANVSVLTGLTANPDSALLGFWSAGNNAFTIPVNEGINPSLSLQSLSPSYINSDAPSATLTLTQPTDLGTFSSYSITGSPNAISSRLGALTYTPCGFFVTQDINGVDTTGTIPAGRVNASNGACDNPASGGVTFGYSIADGISNQNMSAMGTINIRALTSFQTNPDNQANSNAIYAILSQPGTLGPRLGCNICHAAPTGPTWSYTSSQEGTTYASIIGGHDLTNSALPLIVPGNPSQSPFYTAACLGTYALQGMPQIFSATDIQCLTIYQWILEGAQND
jgi:cytochrome c5